MNTIEMQNVNSYKNFKLESVDRFYGIIFLNHMAKEKLFLTRIFMYHLTIQHRLFLSASFMWLRWNFLIACIYSSFILDRSKQKWEIEVLICQAIIIKKNVHFFFLQRNNITIINRIGLISLLWCVDDCRSSIISTVAIMPNDVKKTYLCRVCMCDVSIVMMIFINKT